MQDAGLLSDLYWELFYAPMKRPKRRSGAALDLYQDSMPKERCDGSSSRVTTFIGERATTRNDACCKTTDGGLPPDSDHQGQKGFNLDQEGTILKINGTEYTANLTLNLEEMTLLCAGMMGN